MGFYRSAGGSHRPLPPHFPRDFKRSVRRRTPRAATVCPRFVPGPAAVYALHIRRNGHAGGSSRRRPDVLLPRRVFRVGRRNRHNQDDREGLAVEQVRREPPPERRLLRRLVKVAPDTAPHARGHRHALLADGEFEGHDTNRVGLRDAGEFRSNVGDLLRRWRRASHPAVRLCPEDCGAAGGVRTAGSCWLWWRGWRWWPLLWPRRRPMPGR
jgi:hypothetical protein